MRRIVAMTVLSPKTRQLAPLIRQSVFVRITWSPICGKASHLVNLGVQSHVPAEPFGKVRDRLTTAHCKSIRRLFLVSLVDRAYLLAQNVFGNRTIAPIDQALDQKWPGCEGRGRIGNIS